MNQHKPLQKTVRFKTKNKHAIKIRTDSSDSHYNTNTSEQHVKT